MDEDLNEAITDINAFRASMAEWEISEARRLQRANSMEGKLEAAIKEGDIQKVSELMAAGADIHYRTENGGDAILAAVYGEPRDHGPRLMEMLRFLIVNGVSVSGKTSYGESAVREVSRVGHFDAVHLLLNAGADPNDVQFTDLVKAVAFGSLPDVERVSTHGVDLEERDLWERTAWLIAIQTGDIAKAKYLLANGARSDVRGRCGKQPLFYAIELVFPVACHGPARF